VVNKHRLLDSDHPPIVIAGNIAGRHRLSARSANQFRPIDAAWAKNGTAVLGGYIGRVGALAVALGIGAVVAGTPGTAWADTENAPTTPTTPITPTETGSETGGTTDTGATAPTTPGTESAPDVKSPNSPDPPESSPVATSPSQSTVNLGDGVVLSSSGGAHTSSDSASTTRVDLGGGVALSSSGGAHTSSESAAKPTTAKVPDGATATANQTATVAAAVPARHPDRKSNHDSPPHQSAQPHTPHKPAVTTTPQVSAATVSIDVATRVRAATPTQSPARTIDSPRVAVRSTSSDLSIIQAAPALATDQSSESVAQKALSVLLGPLLAPGTNGPIETPFMWALLAAARRQVGPETQSVSLTDGNLLRANVETVDLTGDAGTAGYVSVADWGSDSVPFGADRFVGYCDPHDFGSVTTLLAGVPLELHVSPDGAHIFAFIETDAHGNASYSVLAMDAATNATQSLPVPGYPGGFTASPDSAHVYFFTMTGDANTGHDYTFIAVDSATGVADSIALPDSVGSIAVSPDSARVYVATGNVIMVYDPTSGATHNIPIADLSDAGYVSFSPNGSHAYVTGWSDSAETFAVAMIDTATERAQSFALRGFATGPVVVTNAGKAVVLTPNGQYGRAATPYHDVTVVDPATATARRIPVNGKVTAFTPAPDGTRIYAAYEGYGDSPDAAGVYIIDPDTDTARDIRLSGWGPNLTVSPTSAHVFASTYINGEHQLSAIDSPTDSTSSLGRIGNPSSLVVSPDGSRAYFLTDTDVGEGQYRCDVAALDTATHDMELISVGQATRLIVSPDGRYVLAPSTTFEPSGGTYQHELAVIDTAIGGMKSAAIPMPGSVVDIQFSPDGSTVYATNCALESGGCGFSLTAIAARGDAPRRATSDSRSALRLFPLDTVAV
jgi:hypothetical protein